MIREQKGHRAMAKRKDNDQSNLMLGGKEVRKRLGTWLAQHTITETRCQPALGEMSCTGFQPVSKPGSRM